MRAKLQNGALDEAAVEIEVKTSAFNTDSDEPNGVPEGLIKLIDMGEKKVKRKVKLKEAKKALENEAKEELFDKEEMKAQALKRVENEGIIFIDEIDKVAVSSRTNGSEPSKEGVQRDLLPIVEGSVVKTKIGAVKTDHILFIAAGAFHLSKPSDLIPELQGRFPLRVTLDGLDEAALYEILTKPKNSLINQYTALLATEGVELVFEDAALKRIAALTALANENVEDIGARRLHTVLEKVLEDISFAADEFSGQTYTITAEFVESKLENTAKDKDLAKYIL